MHIVIDIGNTTIAFAVVDKNKIITVKRMDTNVKNESLKLQLAGVLRGLSRSGIFTGLAALLSGHAGFG